MSGAPGATATPEQLKQWFDAIDVHKRGYITAMELQSVLAKGGLHFSLATVAHIIRIHDRSGNGGLTLAEFARLHEFLTNVQHSFEYFDHDRTSKLTYEEIHRALEHAGYNLEKRALELVFRRFDPSRTGALSLPEFLALTLFLRSATATFNAFDSQRSGHIHLNFNQFLYAAANTI